MESDISKKGNQCHAGQAREMMTLTSVLHGASLLISVHGRIAGGKKKKKRQNGHHGSVIEMTETLEFCMCVNIATADF